jgi:hypothetical protein
MELYKGFAVGFVVLALAAFTCWYLNMLLIRISDAMDDYPWPSKIILVIPFLILLPIVMVINLSIIGAALAGLFSGARSLKRALDD